MCWLGFAMLYISLFLDKSYLCALTGVLIIVLSVIGLFVLFILSKLSCKYDSKILELRHKVLITKEMIK